MAAGSVSGAIKLSAAPDTPAEGNRTIVVNGVASGTQQVTAATVDHDILLPPLIPTQPVSQSLLVGETALFSVTASGTAPLMCQWRKGGV